MVIAAGIDGCRAGWVAALAHGDPDPDPDADPMRPRRTELRRFDDTAALLAWRERSPEAAGAIVGLDLPMGLPATAGPRPCDREARRALGRRWMSVFSAPDRELLGLDFAAARAVVHERRRAQPAARHEVLTHQAINIAPRIEQLDRALRADPARQEWLLEVCPELSFQVMAGAPLASKRTAPGAIARRQLIAQRFPDAPAQLDAVSWPRSAVAGDDLLDAYAALWSALRFAAPGPGTCRVLGDGVRDACGLAQRIVV